MTAIYLTEPQTVVRYHNHTLIIQQSKGSTTCRLAEVDLVVILPGVQLTDSTIAQLLDRGIETIFLRQDGRFRGRLQGHFHTNPTVRLAQYRALDTTFSMAIAQKLILGKVRNQRYLLQRRNRETQGKITQLTEAIDTIASYFPRLKQTETPLDRNELMGVEGVCARIYFQALTHWFPPEWKFTGRNRRPPKDPVNALLSWGYGVLLARVFAATVQAGLDPYLGFFHANAPFRPNLVLDLMEEFRPVVVDRAAIALINGGLIDPNDFEPAPGEEEGIWLGQTAKKLYLAQLERQLQDSILYLPQNRKLKLSQILLEQGRSLGRCLVETRLDYESFTLR